MRIGWKFGRSKMDSEKAVLPAILFINTNHPSFKDLRKKGFMIALGWWDWSVKVWVLE